MNIENTVKLLLKNKNFENGDIIHLDNIIFQIVQKIKECDNYTEYEGIKLIDYD